MKIISINKLKVFLILLLVCLISNFVCAAGTNNNDKQFTPASEMSPKDWNDPLELERVWQAALVRVPSDGGEFISTSVDYLSEEDIVQIQKYPTVIYLHGCAGVWQGTYTRINFLASNGYAVIAPVSFARDKYPKSCDVDTKQASFYRGTLRMRQYDAAYAIQKAKTLSWVDSDNLFLMGLSQGGITTATFSSDSGQESLNARIVEGWTCHAGWSEYKGINAPKSEPVLTLVGKNDPWFQNPWTKGDCSSSLNKHNGSRSIVYTDGHLSQQHELLEFEEVQTAVLQFLRSHTKYTSGTIF